MLRPPKNFTHGEPVRWRKVGGLFLAEVVYQPDQVVPRHSHPNARFVLVLQGALNEARGDSARSFGASSLLFRTAGEDHAYAVSPRGATCLVVDIESGWYARACEQAPVLTQSAAFSGGFVLHLAHRLYGEFRLRDEVSRLAIESLALGVLAEASRSAARGGARAIPVWLHRARTLVEQHFAEPLPLAAVAERVGVHPVHLARTFRRCYHTTFSGYVRELRIEFARTALAGTSAPLSDIAAAAGFCDQSHFSRLFKRHTGQTPAEYRLALSAR
jgi:AraC family transcriptional regulator